MTTATSFTKEIVFDRETRDFALYLNGEFIGFAATYSEGEKTLDELVYNALIHNAALPEPKQVPVSNKETALVDEEDYPRVTAHSWHLNGRGYAITTLYRPKRTISLHRFITQATDDEEVDHRNGNKLDCRKSNLRIATRGQNNHNRGKRRDGRSSQYKGVRKHSNCDRWEANIGIDGQRKYLGLHATEEDAARAYDAAAQRAYGEFAHLNFDRHVFELLTSDLVIPATALDGVCACGATLDSMGLCGCKDEKVVETPRHTIFCVCSAAGVILTPEGAFCGACYEAQSLWQLWKTDSTAFVWMLRQQQARLDEMAGRLATYLSRKNNACLSCDSILTMWRQLLDDGEPPEPRYYVVAARQQVAA